MPILVCALLSLLVAWFRGASPLRLAALRFRFLPLPLLAFAIQAVAFVRFGDAAAPYAVLVHVLSIGLLAIFLLANLTYRSLALVFAGTCLNLLVVTTNGGYMPVRIADVARAGFPQVAAELSAHGHFQKSRSLDAQTRFPWLADVLYLPLPAGPGRMISIGDTLVALGMVWFIQEALLGAPANRGSLPAPTPDRLAT